LVLVGFCSVDVKLPGPLHAYVAPPDEPKVTVPPEHIGFGVAVAVAVGV